MNPRIPHWHSRIDRVVRTIDNLRLEMEHASNPPSTVLARLDAAYAHARGARDHIEQHIEQAKETA